VFDVFSFNPPVVSFLNNLPPPPRGKQKVRFFFLAKNHSPLEEGEEYEKRVFRGIEAFTLYLNHDL
jgi:hypothetical protein